MLPQSRLLGNIRASRCETVNTLRGAIAPCYICSRATVNGLACISMRKSFLIKCCLIASLTACGADDSAQPGVENKPGSDRDEYGCIRSAGYQWCERTGQCERPWELSASEGFENTSEGFLGYCKP